jgi:hypothetical protein
MQTGVGLKHAASRHEIALCVLFCLSALIPKLDVAGSTPVSRSKFSLTWEESKIKRYSVYSVFLLKSAERPVSRLSTSDFGILNWALPQFWCNLMARCW